MLHCMGYIMCITEIRTTLILKWIFGKGFHFHFISLFFLSCQATDIGNVSLSLYMVYSGVRSVRLCCNGKPCDKSERQVYLQRSKMLNIRKPKHAHRVHFERLCCIGELYSVSMDFVLFVLYYYHTRIQHC
jgi:hypothetical protein